MKKALALLVVSTVPAVSLAQVVTPVPPASPVAPAWTPPPEAPKPPPPPVEADVPTPDIVKLDASGRLIWPDKPYEIVAFEGITIDEGQRKQWTDKWAVRLSQQDEMIIKNLGEVIKLREQVGTIDSMNDWNDLIKMATPINKFLAVQPQLEQFVKTSQILRPKQLAAFTEAVSHFRKESTNDLNKRVGSDTTKLMVEKSRDSIKERSQEGFIAFDRMLAALAGNWAKTKDAFKLTGDFAAGEKLAADAKDDKARAAAGYALLKAIPADRQAEVLGSFRTPAPTPPKPPADPGTQGVEIPKAPAVKPPAGK